MKRTGREHFCFRCYCPISGTRHSSIQRVRDKRAWKRLEAAAN
jgi:hypothetical protein